MDLDLFKRIQNPELRARLIESFSSDAMSEKERNLLLSNVSDLDNLTSQINEKRKQEEAEILSQSQIDNLFDKYVADMKQVEVKKPKSNIDIKDYKMLSQDQVDEYLSEFGCVDMPEKCD